MCLKIIIIIAFIFQLSIASGRRVNGTVPSYYVVLWTENGKQKEVCGGVLIRYNWVLTSATCIQNLFSKSDLIKVGAGYRAHHGPQQTRRAIKYISDGEYKLNFKNVALVKLDNEYCKTKEVTLANLPKQNEKICSNPEIVTVFVENYLVTRRIPWWVKTKWKLSKYMATLTSEQVVRRWCRCNHNEIMYAVTFSNRPKRVCDNQIGGWPLFCGDTVMGIEDKCKQRSGNITRDAVANFSTVESNINFILKVDTWDQMKLDKPKPDGNQKTNKASHLHRMSGNVWMSVLLLSLTALFLY